MSSISPEFNQLLEDPNTKLEQVLENSNLPNASRCGSPQLLKFINNEEILNGLFNWCLSTQFVDQQQQNQPPGSIENGRIVQGALSILTSINNSFQNFFASNPVYLNRLKEYMDDTDNDQRFAGHFYQILKNMVKSTNGNYLTNLPNLATFLIKNLTHFCYRDLLIFLLSSDFSSKFAIDKEIICSIAKASNSYCNSTVLFQALTENKELFKYFQDNDAIELLLKAGVETTNPLVATEIFRTVQLIEQKHKHEDLIKKYAELYHFRDDCALSAAVKAFKKLTPEIVLKIFAEPSNSLLNDAIFEVFRVLSKEEKTELVVQTDLYTKLMENFNKVKSNGHLTKLAEYLALLKGIPTPDTWRDFYRSKLNGHLILMESPYGGDIDVSDSIMSDEEDEDDDFDDDDDVY
ncbi:hypothetical protein TRFO_18600 [Tritrichomonas foetus]|uniref:Uncharacterized protein n=1 Tax=Tritrichomonas foetus TaxID=1144522 RepID=A0A1J4KQ42_9EUKA|nr:hypothetical protein TRFO_18600 [Tritrichomonas foetus]|eukprot:OHT11814.1 hypothetical protein TRFO_18600 [Tritrichomonas foetus]